MPRVMKLRWTYLIASLAIACSSADRDNNNNNPPPSNSCGDGVVAGSEECDDGNLESGDGCSATCMNETPSTCGNGTLDPGEECDDNNTNPGDGCSATCTEEQSGNSDGTCNAPFQLALTNNGGDLEGHGEGDTTTSTDQVAEATCDGFPSGAGKDHIWAFTLPAPSDVYILVDDELSAFDTVLRVLAAPCDVMTEIAEFAGADGCADGLGASEFLGYVSLPAGTYYIVVDGYTAQDEGMYAFDFLAVPSTCGDGVLDPLEFCDDADNAPGDGCDAKCEIEDGYTCDFSEPSVCTMDSSAVAPTPGDLVINEFMAADNMSDTNCDGKTTGTDDEFIELVNVSGTPLDLNGVTIADSVVVRHTFGAVVLPPGQALVVWNAGTPQCPGVTLFDVASSGQLGLNDNGDTITLKLGATTLATVTYADSDVDVNISNTLVPDLVGTNYAQHPVVAGTGVQYSPGMRSDGTPF